MPINYRPATFSAPTDFGGAGTGTKELGYAGLSTNVEAQLSGPVDVHSAHAFFRPGFDATAASLPAVTPGVEHAALAVAPGQEPISPIIQMIMKMPGHIGLVNSFFEWLGHMFAPAHDLLANVDLSVLGAHAQEAMSTVSTAAAEHLPINPSLLPADAPILHSGPNLDLANHMPAAEHSTANPLQVSGQLDPHKPQFETGSSASHASTGRSELISGPSISESSPANHLAGMQRLFTDKLSHTPLNPLSPSAALAQSAPVSSTAATSLNVGASPFGPDLGKLQAAPPMEAQSSFGPSGAVSDTLGGRQVLASNDIASSQFGSPSGDNITGLKAQALSLPGLKHANLNAIHANNVQDHISHQSKGLINGGPKNSTLELIRKIGHPQSQLAKPKFSSDLAAASNTLDHKEALHQAIGHKATAMHHLPAKHVSHVASHHAEHLSNQGKLADATTQPASAADSSSYTVRAGDNLWSIAKGKLGSGFKWQEIYKLNKDLLGTNPDMLRAGTTIHLPGVSGGADVASSAVTEASKYVVQPGDSLWAIAKDHLGGADHWAELFKTNSSVIGSNPDLIMPGQELSLPGVQVASAAPVNPADMAASAATQQPQALAPVSAIPANPVLPASGLDHALPPSGGASAATVQVASQNPSPVSASLRPDLSFFTGKGH